MTAGELGFVLLTSHLGCPDRDVLSVPQMRSVAELMASARVEDPDKELEVSDLIGLGFDFLLAENIVELLETPEKAEAYITRGARSDCTALTWTSPAYPEVLRKKLGADAPGVLWAKGDISLLTTSCIALVGSRDLGAKGADFAVHTGIQAAKQGYTLISGNARGADRYAQDAALENGGRVISIVADSLTDKPLRKNLLYLSQEDFDARFSPYRALGRNRVIHALAEAVFVAQCGLYKGGTWSGTYQNLRRGWTKVYVNQDSSAAAQALKALGAELVCKDDIKDILRR